MHYLHALGAVASQFARCAHPSRRLRRGRIYARPRSTLHYEITVRTKYFGRQQAFLHLPPESDIICTLRRKLESIGHANVIQTFRGYGYRLSPNYLTRTTIGTALRMFLSVRNFSRISSMSSARLINTLFRHWRTPMITPNAVAKQAMTFAHCTISSILIQFMVSKG